MNDVKPHRLLLISQFTPPVGGVQTWTHIIYNELSRRGDVDVKIIDTATHWRNLNDTRLWRRLIGGTLQALRDSFRAIRAMRSFKPDCVHLNTSASFANAKDWLILRAAKMFGIRTVIEYHVGFLPYAAENQTLQWHFLRANMLLADKVLILGSRAVEVIKKHLPQANVQSVTSPIEISNIVSKPSLPRDGRPTRFLFLGHMTEGKGVYVLIKAAMGMDKARFHLTMAGNIQPQAREKLLALAGPDSSAWLNIAGELPRQQCLEELARADVFVLPSLFEAGPLVVVEAMASQRAVISTDRGAIVEMLNIDSQNPCGLLVEAGNVESLRKAMEKLMNDPQLTLFLGANGRARALSVFDVAVVVDGFLKIWFDEHHASAS